MVIYVDSERLRLECDRIPQIKGRASLVHSLIAAYGLLDDVTIITSRLAREEEINSFHSGLYIDFLKRMNSCDDLEKHEAEQEEYGLGYDCPLLEKIFDFVQVIGGGSVTAAEALIATGSKVAINWCGGWHHAQRDGAEGFCYVNDVALAILKLCQKFGRVLYIDLDLHHGNGVENAFSCSRRVMTVSFHHYGPGIYPCTGQVEDVGSWKGRYYSVNVPLQEGIRDESYFDVFQRVMDEVFPAYRPDALVVQCGADVLSGDPVGLEFNLTLNGLGSCVKLLLSRDLPTLFLGGGGYHLANTARCWAYLTALIVGRTLSTDIPEHDKYEKYGPYFELEVAASYRPDHNTKEYVDSIVKIITENLKNVRKQEGTESGNATV